MENGIEFFIAITVLGIATVYVISSIRNDNV